MAKKSKKAAGKGSAGQNRKQGEVFLEKHRQRTDVHLRDSGLMYRVIQANKDSSAKNDHSSPSPTENPGRGSVMLTDQITIHQRLGLADGSIIVDSYRDDTPDTFIVDSAIDGLKEGLLLMCEGERYEFVIPPELGWGKKGNRSNIGPNAVMIIDVKILNVQRDYS